MEKLIIRESEKRSMACLTRRCLLLAICLIALTRISFAQDIIVTVDSQNESRIRAKVTEVTADSVKYKNFDNQDGPVYSLTKSVVSAIIYESGNVETFFEFEAPKIEQPAQQITTRETPAIRTDPSKISPENLLEEMKRRDPDLYSKYAAGKKTKTTGWIVSGTGIAVIAGGAVWAVMGMQWDDSDVIKQGAIIAGAGAVITGVGIPVIMKGSKKKKSAIEEFKSQYYSSDSTSPYFRINLYGDRVGLAFVF